MTMHCLLAGHDVIATRDDRCAHCRASLPISRARIAGEAALRVVLAIALALVVTAARVAPRWSGAGPTAQVKTSGD